jgi:hypothetical protein
MKKVLVIILSFFYLTSSIGATIHLHYCMDRLAEWSFWHNNDKQCGKCGMEKSQEKNSGCCKDEHKQFKLESDHTFSAAYMLSDLVSIAVPTPLFELFDIKLPTVTEKNPLSHAPPRSRGIAVYIQNCVFRI